MNSNKCSFFPLIILLFIATFVFNNKNNLNSTIMKYQILSFLRWCILLITFTTSCHSPLSQKNTMQAYPSLKDMQLPFKSNDEKAFMTPNKVNYPETWFHYIGGNVSHEGISADLEAIASAGISGVQLFHGQFGGQWPATTDDIQCMSENWEVAVRHTAEECKRLGLRFTMQNCPGWAMSGGPWIKPENAMRTIVYSRMDVTGKNIQAQLPIPEPNKEEWRDYRDIAVLAFPTPEGDTEIGRAHV